MIQHTCPHCSTLLTSEDFMAGVVIYCRHCQEQVFVPGASATTTADDSIAEVIPVRKSPVVDRPDDSIATVLPAPSFADRCHTVLHSDGVHLLPVKKSTPDDGNTNKPWKKDATDITVETSGDTIRIHVPRLGFFGVHLGYTIYIIFYALLLLGALPFALYGWQLFQTDGNPAGLLCPCGTGFFFLVWVWFIVLALFGGQRSATIEASKDMLTVWERGLFGTSHLTWFRDDLQLVRVRRKNLNVNGISTTQLEITTAKAIVGILPNRWEAELQGIAELLSRKLGVLTPANWDAQPPRGKPLPRPQKTRMQFDYIRPDHVRFRVAVSGLWQIIPGVLLFFLFSLGCVASFVIAQLATENPELASMLFLSLFSVLGVLLLLQILNVWLWSPKVTLTVQNGEVTLDKPGFGGGRTTWHKAHIQQILVEFVRVSSSKGGGRIHIELHIQTRDDKVTLLDHRQLNGINEYDVYWIADTIHRALHGVAVVDG